MFNLVKTANLWRPVEGDHPSIRVPEACVEVPMPVDIWRKLFKRPNGPRDALEGDVEVWEFKFNYMDEYILGAIYKGAMHPVIYLTMRDLTDDFFEHLQEGLDLIYPMLKIDKWSN